MQLIYLFAMLGAVLAQNPPPAKSSPTVFSGEAAVVLNYVKSDKAADFESVMGRVKEALQKSPVPERRQQALGWKIYKASDQAGEGQVLYISVIDPVVKGADYSISQILSEVFPAEARALYDRYLAAFSKGRLAINADPLAPR